MGDSDVAGGHGTAQRSHAVGRTEDVDVVDAPDEPPEALLASVAAPMIQILGLFLTVGAFLAWREGGDVELPTVALVLAGVVVAVGVAFAWRGDTLLGLVVSAPPAVVATVFVVLCAGVLAAIMFLPSVHLTLSTVPVAIIGVVSLVGPMVEAVQHRRASRGARGGSGSPDRLFNTVLAYLVWQVPLAAGLLVGALWLADVTG